MKFMFWVLFEALPIRTHNICFFEETRKIFCGYPVLSGVMGTCLCFVTGEVDLMLQKEGILLADIEDANLDSL